MAFFVGRRDGRYELRESVATGVGPRARTLANFACLTPEVLDRAASRAIRPLDRDRLWAKAVRDGIPTRGVERPADPRAADGPEDYRGFVAASRRLGAALDGETRAVKGDPGRAVVDLAALVEAIRSPRRRPPVLEYPVLARISH